MRPPLRKILRLEPGDNDEFVGRSHVAAPRIYGGQVVAQSLMAATATVPDQRRVHSVHGHFLHPGNAALPVTYDVERLRDGGSFTSRAVRAHQDGRCIFTSTSSFQREEDGLGHYRRPSASSIAPEDLPTLDETLSDSELAAAAWLPALLQGVSVDFRFPEEYPRIANARGEARPPQQRAWVRAPEPLGDDAAVHAAAFAYISDLFLLSSALPPHAITIDHPRLQLASLDHTVYFHEQFRMDDWLLYEQEGSWMGHSRGLCHGFLYDRSGRLLASTTQEGLLRLREHKS